MQPEVAWVVWKWTQAVHPLYAVIMVSIHFCSLGAHSEFGHRSEDSTCNNLPDVHLLWSSRLFLETGHLSQKHSFPSPQCLPSH